MLCIRLGHTVFLKFNIKFESRDDFPFAYRAVVYAQFILIRRINDFTVLKGLREP